MKNLLVIISGILILAGCKKSDPVPPALAFKLAFDQQQIRLNNRGEESVIPPGNAAQTPSFKEMSLHYIELTENEFTPLGQGLVLYKADETTTGGENAIDFDKSVKAGNGEEFFRIDLKDLKPGNYKYVRASVSYQNYTILYNINDIPSVGDLRQQSGTLASFVGFKTFIKNVVPRTQELTVNANMPQGYWVFETDLQSPFDVLNKLYFGQAPAGATTVVNPLFNTSPIPPGSCVVTGQFKEPLVIAGENTADIVVKLSFSINKSFEWIDDNANGELDFYGAAGKPNERVIDMGLRGLIPSIE